MVMKSQSSFSPDAASQTSIRTLLVDDSPMMLKLLALILKRAGGFEIVGSATNASQALSYVSALSPELVLMDVHMPGMTGIEAIHYLKGQENPPVVILVTSDDDPLTRAKADQAGADRLIIKDKNLGDSLVAALRDIFAPFGARSPYSPCAAQA